MVGTLEEFKQGLVLPYIRSFVIVIKGTYLLDGLWPTGK